MSSVKDLKFKLYNGVEIPSIGFGTWQISNDDVYQATLEALKAGYRHIDTAYRYENEEGVGRAIKDSGIPREEIFVTTKLPSDIKSYEGAVYHFNDSLKKLGLDYIDLYLIHAPWPWSMVGRNCRDKNADVWKAFEEFYLAKKVRAIGISNFNRNDITHLINHSQIKPMVNQIEINPFCQNEEAIKIMSEIGVAPQAWAPLAEGKNGLFTHPVLSAIAQKHHVSVAQVVLRYVMMLGASVVVKSIHANRMEENLKSTAVVLDAEDMAAIKKLDTKTSQFFSHRDPAIIRWMCERHLEH